jgi:hypothetical protein
LALLFGVGAGFGALAVAWVCVHLWLYEWLLLHLGVGGTTY